jgi:hypothetical protein
MVEEIQQKDKSTWNYYQVMWVFIVTILCQNIFLPEFSCYGEVKLKIAFMIDAMILVRVIAAYFLREKGRGWIVYCVLLYLSTPFIELYAYIFLEKRIGIEM